jgi:hypothetical protein
MVSNELFYMVAADLGMLEAHGEEMQEGGWSKYDWDISTALKVRGEEMREKGQEEVLDLMEQGYSAQQIRDMLARQPNTPPLPMHKQRPLPSAPPLL